MNPLHFEACSILQTAEKGLRGLMERAVQQGRYNEVAHLAEMAMALSQVAREWAGVDPNGEPGCTEAQTGAVGRAAGALATVPVVVNVAKMATTILGDTASDYPRFELDEDRLVKIAWSKREKAEYQHKVSRDVARAVYMHLGEVPSTTTFRMQDLLPVKMHDGTEVPSYQSYLVLAWLRHINQIEKRANDSYQWVMEDISKSSFNKAWEATPRNGAQMKRRGK